MIKETKCISESSERKKFAKHLRNLFSYHRVRLLVKIIFVSFYIIIKVY